MFDVIFQPMAKKLKRKHYISKDDYISDSITGGAPGFDNAVLDTLHDFDEGKLSDSHSIPQNCYLALFGYNLIVA